MQLTQCPKCEQPIKTIPAGISKRTGKKYNEFQACSNIACDWKPDRSKSDLNALGRTYQSTADVRDDVSRTGIQEAMSRKEASINKFVDKKEQGMIYFAALRSAGEFMTVMIDRNENPEPMTPDDYHELFWKEQRRFMKEITEDPQR